MKMTSSINQSYAVQAIQGVPDDGTAAVSAQAVADSTSDAATAQLGKSRSSLVCAYFQMYVFNYRTPSGSSKYVMNSVMCRSAHT